jgi:hypothetical protein
MTKNCYSIFKKLEPACKNSNNVKPNDPDHKITQKELGNHVSTIRSTTKRLIRTPFNILQNQENEISNEVKNENKRIQEKKPNLDKNLDQNLKDIECNE